jgi:hypothetical protein
MKSLFTRKYEKGQSLLELALVLLVMILIVSGLVDLGRVLFYYQTMRDAAQEGASYGSAFPTACQEITNRTLKSLPSDINQSNVKVYIKNVLCTSPTAVENIACSGNDIKIVITKPDFPIIMPVVGFFVGQSIRLEATITDTILRPVCVIKP